MNETVNLYAAKTNLSRLVERAAAGEEIIIAKSGKPKAKLVPYRAPRRKRVGGQNLLGITFIATTSTARCRRKYKSISSRTRASPDRYAHFFVVGPAIAARTT